MLRPHRLSRKAPLSILAATFAIGSPAVAADAPSPLAILGVPVGATVADVEAMARSRGYRAQARPQYCTSGEYCTLRANVENFPGTEFLAQLNGVVRDATREESFNFYFTGPPNASRVWSAGLDQKFGDWFRPSAAAPLVGDALAAVRARFGPTSYEEGTITDMSTRGSGVEMVWFWDAQGRLIKPPSLPRYRWPRPAAEAWNNCNVALAKAKVTPGFGYSSVQNMVATDPTPFQLARSGKCARAARVEIGQTRGQMHTLYIRVIDFQAGYDALFHTTKLVAEKRAAANRTRSETNRPDF